jgi:hypothetical protein
VTDERNARPHNVVLGGPQRPNQRSAPGGQRLSWSRTRGGYPISSWLDKDLFLKVREGEAGLGRILLRVRAIFVETTQWLQTM